jgi:hypothetical protein
MSEITARTVGDVQRDNRAEEEHVFARDTYHHQNEGRFEIDAFRFARYLALGWIRTVDAFPYYELTPNGEEVYWTVIEDGQLNVSWLP